MVIRLTKATRFFCVCVLLIVTALISIGTRSMSVSAPYRTRSSPLPVVAYRGIKDGSPAAPSLRDLQADLDFLLESAYTVLSEQELVSALRRERELPPQPLLLLFDDSAKEFSTQLKPLLIERELPWFSLEQSTVLTRELRAAGYPIVRLERTAVFALEEQLKAGF